MGRNKSEKIIKEIRIRIQPSLYDKLFEKSKKEYKNISEVIRFLVKEYVEKNNA